MIYFFIMQLYKGRKKAFWLYGDRNFTKTSFNFLKFIFKIYIVFERIRN